MAKDKTQFTEMLDSATKMAAPEIVSIKNGSSSEAQLLVVPDGKKVIEVKTFLEKYLTAPERRKGTATVTTLQSFIDHANRFKDDDSALFANNSRTAPSLTAVLDYNRKTSDGAPRFGEHRTHYKFPLSKEWLWWMGSDGKTFSQTDFAVFIEDRIGEVLSPYDGDTEDESLRQLSALLGGNFAGPSTVVTLSRELAINEESRVRNAIDLSTGETKVVYETEHKDQTGAPVKVPNFFLIGIPVFEGGDAYRIAVRLRYRIRSGSIAWSYSLYAIDKVFDDAFDGACKEAQEKTGLPLFIGAPE